MFFHVWMSFNHSVNVLSCMDVIQSFVYVLRDIILDVAEKCRESVQEKVRGDTIKNKTKQKHK